MQDPPLSRVRDRRRQLQHALVQLETALAGAAGQPAEWCERVAAALSRLAGTLDDHVAGTEDRGGLFEHVVAREPRLASRVDQLRHEHERLATGVAVLLTRCRGVAPDAEEVDALREAGLDLLRELSRHRQRGADLLYEAYAVDLAAGD